MIGRYDLLFAIYAKLVKTLALMLFHLIVDTKVNNNKDKLLLH
jgi:hypothetical protein